MGADSYIESVLLRLTRRIGSVLNFVSLKIWDFPISGIRDELMESPVSTLHGFCLHLWPSG